MKLIPLYDRIVIEPISESNQSESGLFTSVEEKKSDRATVLAVGQGYYEDGKTYPLTVKVDDVVVYSKYAGSEVKIGSRTVRIVRESEILAIEEKGDY